jgi:hypothetical protein
MSKEFLDQTGLGHVLLSLQQGITAFAQTSGAVMLLCGIYDDKTDTWKAYKYDENGEHTNIEIPPQRVGVGRFQLYGDYPSYPPPFAMVSVSAGGITLLNNSAMNPLAVDVSGYNYETLHVNFEGMVPITQSGVQFSLFNKQTGSAIYAYGYWSGKQLQIYNLRDLWYGLNQPTGVREIEIRLFDGIYGYYGSNVSVQDSFFVGSIWIDFQP